MLIAHISVAYQSRIYGVYRLGHFFVVCKVKIIEMEADIPHWIVHKVYGKKDKGDFFLHYRLYARENFVTVK